MLNTDKTVCRMLAAMLADYGVEDVVLCPGSRNAPLIMAVSRNDTLCHRTVVDERSACFAALGMCAVTRQPVAVVCTSGSAVLDMAPAVAEAYYRHLPLIVISADRPARWIDQADSQTIRQPGALQAVTGMCVNITDSETPADLWHANRLVNDALTRACAGIPVHINVQLDAPLTAVTDVGDETFRVIDTIRPEGTISNAEARALGRMLNAEGRVLVLCGDMAPSAKVSRALGKIAALPNTVVAAEAQANVHAAGVVYNLDAVVAAMNAEQRRDLAPDVVITVGGALVSARVKEWLRTTPGLHHWAIGGAGHAQDTFMCMERHLRMSAANCLPLLASAMQPARTSDSTYAADMRALAYEVSERTAALLEQAPWSDVKAVTALLNLVPGNTNVQLSNGMTVRYAQLVDTARLHRVDGNRGVSGIDGSTSTAIGASWAYDATTLLITGDMSAQYDIGALNLPDVSPHFRMAVVSNGGGNIFRTIRTTRDLPELEESFAVGVPVSWPDIARAYGWEYIEVTDMETLAAALPAIARRSKAPMLINIVTDGPASAAAYRTLIANLSTQNL